MNHREKRSIQNIRLHRPDLSESIIYRHAQKLAERSSYCTEHFLNVAAYRAASKHKLPWK